MPGGVSGKKKKNSGPPPVPGSRGTLTLPRLRYTVQYLSRVAARCSLVAGRLETSVLHPASRTLHQINLAGVQVRR
jgi:hypothetical protein